MLGLVPLEKALSWTILTIDTTVVAICTVCVPWLWQQTTKSVVSLSGIVDWSL